jgi:hypothetical protein
MWLQAIFDFLGITTALGMKVFGFVAAVTLPTLGAAISWTVVKVGGLDDYPTE